MRGLLYLLIQNMQTIFISRVAHKGQLAAKKTVINRKVRIHGIIVQNSRFDLINSNNSRIPGIVAGKAKISIAPDFDYL